MNEIPVAPRNTAPTSSWIAANLSPRKNLRYDVPAGLVVFLVALPLCLGIALASGAPLLSGVLCGTIGGLLVSWLSGSPVAVSGPAAGLTVLVFDGITELGMPAFLLAALLGGVIQFVLGLARAGIVAHYFPSTVIRGMLAAIGVILVLKQFPHAIGWDSDHEGDFFFVQADGRSTLSEIPAALEHVHPGACAIAATGLILLVVLARLGPTRVPKWLPGPLVVVLVGVGMNEVFRLAEPALATEGQLLVQIPDLWKAELSDLFVFPDFSAVADAAVLQLALVLAVVASIETLLCVEAADRLDPYRRRSDTNRELRAQGVGNMLCGLLGAIPMTPVIVRTSANIHAGGRTRAASFVHGLFLLLTVVAIPGLLNRVPLAALAAVLIYVGYKLAPWQLFVHTYRQGADQFLPFAITLVAITFTDLLTGVAIGMCAGLFFILRANVKTPLFMHTRDDAALGDARKRIHIRLSENVSFLNKAGVGTALHGLPDGAVVTIDASDTRWIDRDVLEMIHEFAATAPLRGLDVELVAMPPPGSRADELENQRPLRTITTARRADSAPPGTA